MIDDRRDFSDRLIQCESPTPALEDKYRKEITAMLEKEIGPVARAAWVFWTVFGLTMATVFGYVAATAYENLPPWATFGFVAGVVFGLVFAALSGSIAWSGRINLKTHSPAMAGMAWVFVVLMATLTLVFAPDSIVGVRMLVSILLFLVMAAVFMLASRTEQAELRTKEKLLEIEYRIAELGESLDRRGN